MSFIQTFSCLYILIFGVGRLNRLSLNVIKTMGKFRVYCHLLVLNVTSFSSVILGFDVVVVVVVVLPNKVKVKVKILTVLLKK